MYIRIILATALCCVLPVATLGQQADAAGSADHEAISRYKGSVLLFYDEQEYDAYLLPLGGWTRAKRGFESSRTVEGEFRRRSYVAPEGPSVLAVYRNFERAVQNSGLKIQRSHAASGNAQNYTTGQQVPQSTIRRRTARS